MVACISLYTDSISGNESYQNYVKPSHKKILLADIKCLICIDNCLLYFDSSQ
jgi:hypothetical protein